MSPGSICAPRCASSIPASCWMKEPSATTTSAISWPRRTSLWRIKVIGKPPKAPGRWPTGGSAGAASVARCRQSEGNIDLTLLDEPRRNTAPLPASAEHAHRHPPSSGLAALSPGGTPALAPPSQQWPRAIRAAAGSSTRRRFLTPSACSNGLRLAPVGRVKGVMRIAEGGGANQPSGGGSPYRDPQRRSAR